MFSKHYTRRYCQKLIETVETVETHGTQVSTFKVRSFMRLYTCIYTHIYAYIRVKISSLYKFLWKTNAELSR